MCHSESDSESIQGRRSEADDASLSEELDSIERVTQYAEVQVVIRTVGKEEERSQAKRAAANLQISIHAAQMCGPIPEGGKPLNDVVAASNLQLQPLASKTEHFIH